MMNIHNLLPLLLLLFTIGIELYDALDATDRNEYCILENFIPSCSQGEFIVMTQATYGYMGPGRCTKIESDIDCVVDVLSIIGEACSWKTSCVYLVGDIEKQIAKDCFLDTRPYLVAEYQCVNAETAGSCDSPGAHTVQNILGSIASPVADLTKCGSLNSPWKIDARSGQSVSLKISSLVQFPNDASDDTNSCLIAGYVTGVKSRRNVTICHNSPSGEEIYASNGEGIIVQFTQNTVHHDVILEYQVTGCMDLLTPEFAYYNRAGDEALIGCLHRNMSWHLHCVGSNWQGVVGKCPAAATEIPVDIDENIVNKSDYSFLILICAAAVMFAILLIIATIGILKLMDRHKRQKAEQLAMKVMDNNATCYRYSNEPQRTMPMLYHEGTDVVPDLLESSLQRHPQRNIAESECSSQTYYPGTMYFMGLQGPPQQDVQLPLPKPPNADSDSDSDHVYDKIPCD